LLTPGTHGSTFGGNPLVCKTALSVLDTIEQDNILEHVIQMNKYLVSGLQSIATDKVTEIRSKGLMIAIQLNQDCTELLNAALQKKLLINITGRSIRLLPPLIISQAEADIIINTINELLSAL
jgi:acetylornithine aminotransferase